MTSITTRETTGGGAIVKGAPLTNAEIDNNFISITTSKLEASQNLSDLTDTDAAKANLDLASMAAQESTNVDITGGSISDVTFSSSSAIITGGSVTGITDLDVSDGGTGASTASGARTNLGLGSIATQDSDNVSISGGSVTGITDLSVSDGGTGASTASGARTNLGLGSIATQDSTNISVTGGSVTGITDLSVSDGGTGASTALDARNNLGVEIGVDVQGQIQVNNETESTSTFYPLFVNNTSGNLSQTVNVSDNKLFYQPSTGTLNATVFNSLSDAAAKTNVSEISAGLDVVNSIVGVEFNWKDGGEQSAGVIAQQLEKVLPHLVTTTKDDMKSVNYAGLTAYLLSAIQELSSKIK